jgi:RNA polymerase primary sigma factor
MAHLGTNEQKDQSIQRLLARAEMQGYLTAEDILELCPNIAQNKGQFTKLFQMLHTRGIDVLEDETLPTQQPDLDPAYHEKERLSLEHIASDDTVSLYLREMSLTPLLTLEEEVGLAQRIASGRQARDEISRDGHNFERRQEMEALVQDERLARDALIKANTRLVVSIARRYIGRGVPLLDLVQEGNLGLMKAVEKYEYQRGFRFSTYATWWIRQSIVRAIADQGRTIRVPVHMVDRLRQVYKASQDMEQRLGRPPTAQELAVQMDLDSEKLRWMLQVSQPPLSLETPVGEEEEGELGMYVEDVAAPSPAQTTYENMLRERVDEVLATLTPREARVLRLRFGLGQDRAYTLEEVGQKFGLTRERIRQIEGKALRRLRQPSRARLLSEYG